MGASALAPRLLFESDVEQTGRIFQIEKSEHANDSIVFVLDEEGFGPFICVVALLDGSLDGFLCWVFCAMIWPGFCCQQMDKLMFVFFCEFGVCLHGFV